MPRHCTVCTHPNRERIDALLVGGEPYRDIAQQFGVSFYAVHRHKSHLNGALLRAKEVRDVAHADNLLEQVRSLQRKALSILSQAERSGNLKTALLAIREARGCLELLGKLAGELQSAPTVNILISPEWVRLRTLILEALEPYPDARLAVAGALRRLDGGNYSR
jgi:hypothetical protein